MWPSPACEPGGASGTPPGSITSLRNQFTPAQIFARLQTLEVKFWTWPGAASDAPFCSYLSLTTDQSHRKFTQARDDAGGCRILAVFARVPGAAPHAPLRKQPSSTHELRHQNSLKARMIFLGAALFRLFRKGAIFPLLSCRNYPPKTYSRREFRTFHSLRSQRGFSLAIN